MRRACCGRFSGESFGEFERERTSAFRGRGLTESGDWALGPARDACVRGARKTYRAGRARGAGPALLVLRCVVCVSGLAAAGVDCRGSSVCPSRDEFSPRESPQSRQPHDDAGSFVVFPTPLRSSACTEKLFLRIKFAELVHQPRPHTRMHCSCGTIGSAPPT